MNSLLSTRNPSVAALVFTLAHTINAQYDCGGVIYPDVPQSQFCVQEIDNWPDAYKYQDRYIVGEPLNPGATKTIKIAIHVWQDSTGGNNYPDNQATRDMLDEAIGHLNDGMWTYNDAPSDPISGVPFIPDTKLRVDYKGVTFHQNSSMNAIILSSGTSLLSQQAISEDAQMQEYLLLHFVCPTCHFCCDTLGNPLPGIAGVATGTFPGYFGGNHYVASKGQLDPAAVSTWALAQHWAHEIGHTMGLCHTYGPQCAEPCSPSDLDYLSDVFESPSDCLHDGSWNCNVSASTNSCTNNMMGGTNAAGYYSPLQLGRIHRSLATHGARKYAWGYSTTPYTISNNETWEFNIKFYQDIVVPAGKTLTIKCVVEMVPEAKIVVQPGGKLIVDGGTITAAQYSGDFWKGIEVWGDNTKNQGPSTGTPTYQGMVELKNGAVIEHAFKAGIYVGQRGVPNTYGGVVQASDASFINCYRAVEFPPYQNTTAGGSPIANRSWFQRCEFYVDDDYRGGDDFDAHIVMDKVDGIPIKACTFKNLRTTITESAKLGMGIRSLDAHYNVVGLCTTNPPWPGGVCPNWDRSVFIGLDHGINASNATTSRNFTVDRTDFHANIAGVYAKGVTGYQVKNCRFYLGGNDADLTHPDELEWDERHRGIFSTESWAFTVDDNELEQDGAHTQTEGIVIGYSRDHNDIVFRNQATGLERAYIGEGISADVPGNAHIVGLWFLCNENDGNTQNFWSRRIVGLEDEDDHTIRTQQGVLSRPADNTFDQVAGPSGDGDFRVTTTFSTISYRHRNTGAYVPQHYSSGLFPASALAIPTNNCSSKMVVLHPGPKSLGADTLAAHLLGHKQAYGDTRHLYAQLIDGGDTDAVLDEIQASWPTDAWELRDYLLEKSPYLSYEALKAAVVKNIMPAAMLTEVLVANPDATKNGGFLQWLQDESGYALPEYLAGLVVASWDESTYRTTLEEALTIHHGEMTQAANALMEGYRNNATGPKLDSLAWTWRQLRTVAGSYGEALTWLEQQQYDSALFATGEILQDHKLDTTGVAEVLRMQAWIGFLQTIGSTGRHAGQLDSAEVQQLVALAGDTYDRPSTWIYNLLCFHYHICRPPLTGGDDGTPKVWPRSVQQAGGAGTVALLKAQPNPADTWMAFTYDLLVEPKQAALVIRDLVGREVYRRELREQQQQVVWDTRQVPPGTYTATLYNNERQLRTEKVIIRQ